ncbi:hypothetical protein PPACK8108_LOCUS25807 [Phakopsora pachyrhizi]|uniref:Uncharacterized protein n=1 Tax=Phakopsora pachyrhizi TaxID=170000 RepID=A0AAV0BUN8_PHAPC|nr:hypothetical protein PPACK8108_LOCUS25807 [Phakopsora pachyrhizi]
MYSDNEQLYSSEGESEPPKKNFKSNSSIGNSSKAPLSGTSLQGRGLVNPPMQNNHTQEPNSSNRDFFVIPNSNSSHASVSDLDHHTNRPNLSSKNNYERCAHNLTKQSENLGNNTLELLLQTLEAQLEVQTGQESFFRNLSLLNTPAEKHAAIVYILANISQKMEVVIEAISGNQNTANFDSQSNTSHTFLGSNNFVWTKPPKDYIRIMLHQLFISPDVESYTKGTDSDSRVIGNSLFSLAMNNLQNRPKEWKNKYLPISFCKEENEAHSIVSTEVRRILKQERNVFKKKILKNILLQDKNPEQPIPRLIELTKFLLEWAAPKGTSYSNKEVKDKFKNIKIQRRFALLRVCAAYQHFFNHEAPWPKIDEQLEILKKKNSDYRNR